MGAPNVKAPPVKVEKRILPKKSNFVKIKNPKPAKGQAVAAVQGKKFDPTAYGIKKATNALDLKGILADAPYKGVSGKMLVTYSIGKDGKVSEVKCDGSGKNFKLFTSSKLPFKKLAARIAGALANLQFKPGEGAEVQFALVFSLKMAK